MNKFTKRILHKQLALAGVLGVGTFALQNQANAAVTFYTADATKTSIFTVGLTQGSLGNGTLANPTSLTSGSTQFKYTAVNFTPTESGTYKFGQTYSVNDTVMILYDGVYNPLTPGTGALVGNDDTSAAIHQAALGSAVAVQCGPSVNYCPQITYNVVAGMTYTLFVSVYSPSYNNTFTLPFDFYSTGDVIFNIYTGRSPIDLARSTYMSGELGVTVDPIFVGGTLHMNENNGVYAQDFTLSNIATNTIDQYNNYTTFNGKFTDGVAGVPGQITIINSGTDGEVTFNGINTYTGSTTLKSGTLAVSQDANLGDAAATLILDSGTLLATDSFESTRSVTLASTGTVNVESGKNVGLSGITSGSGSWTKEGAGVLVLNAENTYTGSTTLKDGTLSISQDSNLGDTAGVLAFDGGTLLATNSFESSRNVNLVSTGTISVDGGKIVSLSNAVSGAGSWTKDGEGKLVLNADNSYTGSTNVASGTLVIGADSSYSGAALSGGGDVSIADGATLGGYGSVTGNVANSGIIAVGSTIDETSTSPMANFTINGNYVGNDGTLLLNTVLGGDTAITDKLMIAGDATGKTKVLINNLGGSGAKTINGLEVIDVGGVSDNEAFVKEGRIVAGAYDYNLVKGNAAGTNTQSWFLASTDTTRPEAGGYLGLIEFNQGTFNHSFHDRQQLLDNEYKSSWARVEYTHGKSKVGADNELSNKTNRTLIHFGSDIYSKDALHLGVMGGYSKGDIDTSSSRSRDTTSSDSDGYSAGVYGTWFDQGNDKGGLYVDSYAQYNWFSNTLQGSQLDTEKFNTKGATISAEAGYGIALGKTNSMSWMIEPQVQVIYNSYDGKDHTEQNGTRIRTSGSDNVIGRVGVRLQGKSETIQPFVTLNYWTHSDQASISMNDEDVSSNRAKNVAELKVGGQVKVNKNVDLFGQLQASAGSHSTSSYGGNVGVKVNW